MTIAVHITWKGSQKQMTSYDSNWMLCKSKSRITDKWEESASCAVGVLLLEMQAGLTCHAICHESWDKVCGQKWHPSWIRDVWTLVTKLTSIKQSSLVFLGCHEGKAGGKFPRKVSFFFMLTTNSTIILLILTSIDPLFHAISRVLCGNEI